MRAGVEVGVRKVVWKRGKNWCLRCGYDCKLGKRKECRFSSTNRCKESAIETGENKGQENVE